LILLLSTNVISLLKVNHILASLGPFLAFDSIWLIIAFGVEDWSFAIAATSYYWGFGDPTSSFSSGSLQAKPPISISAVAMFNWQAEISSTTTLSPAARVQPSPKPATSNVVSFAQALTASHNVSSNDNLFQPSVRGEAVYIKILHDMYEKGMAACNQNLHGRLLLNKGDKPYMTKDIQLKLQKQWKTDMEDVVFRKGYYMNFLLPWRPIYNLFGQWEQ